MKTFNQFNQTNESSTDVWVVLYQVEPDEADQTPKKLDKSIKVTETGSTENDNGDAVATMKAMVPKNLAKNQNAAEKMILVAYETAELR